MVKREDFHKNVGKNCAEDYTERVDQVGFEEGWEVVGDFGVKHNPNKKEK